MRWIVKTRLKNVKIRGNFTKKQKQQVINDNKKANDGKTICESCKDETVPA